MFALNLYSKHAVWISVPFEVQMGIDENKASDKESKRTNNKDIKRKQPRELRKTKKRLSPECRIFGFSLFLLILIRMRMCARAFAYFITSTNLSPNFIKPKNGFFPFCNTVCLQSHSQKCCFLCLYIAS